MSPQPLSTTYDAGRALLVVAGDIDHGPDLDVFSAMLRRLVEAGGGTVDLTGVTHLPSAAVGHVARQAARSPRLRVVAAPGSIAARVLEVVGLEHEPGPGRLGA